ncbi:NRDE family protein [Pseudalkalibacillus hwajinpoensis]|uniref:NRDE family protein n=1 Tax=Guptibacillus hwajinpoensis TaxID=208199 RepID=UPI00325BB99D
MCLIAVALHAHENYPFVLIANRDEFYERPTKQAHFWEDIPELLAGRDLKSMGTWLGVTKKGKIAALTNYREPAEDTKEKSRGELTADFLKSEQSAETYLTKVGNKGDEYNGFNLLVGKFNELYYYSNRQNEIISMDDGVHAVSNHLMNTSWPKVDFIKEGLSHYLSHHEEFDINELLQLLKRAEPAPDDQLPNTGVPLEWERMLSPIFISSKLYGTRTQTVITISKEGNVTFAEKTVGMEDLKVFQFAIESS